MELRDSGCGLKLENHPTPKNTSKTEIIGHPVCYVKVVVIAASPLGTLTSKCLLDVKTLYPSVSSSHMMNICVDLATLTVWHLTCHFTDIPAPVIVRAEVTADNTSIRVLWEWSCQDLLMCLDIVRVDYQPEGGSLMMYTVDSAIATSATLSNLQCNTQYIISVYAEGGVLNNRSFTVLASLPARGTTLDQHFRLIILYPLLYTPPAPPTPAEVTAQFMNASSVRVAWQWTSSDPAPSCFNTTRVTYHPEGGIESSLQLRDPAATEIILTGLQCNTHYTITVVASAEEHRRESVAFPLLQGILKNP